MFELEVGLVGQNIYSFKWGASVWIV